MAYGKYGATCWLAGAVRTLQKRVEWLEAATTGANTSVSRYKLDDDFKIQDTIPKVRVPRHKPAGDLVYDSKTSGDQRTTTKRSCRTGRTVLTCERPAAVD